MRIFEWNNKKVSEADLFVKLDKEELNNLSGLFPEICNACVDFDGYYVFINSKKQTITPLRKPSLAFGGMYNNHPPYGKELNETTVTFKDLTWQQYTEIELQEMSADPENNIE